MKRIILFASLMLFFLSPLPSVGSEEIQTNTLSSCPGPEYVPGEVLVKYKTDVRASTIEALNLQVGSATIKQFGKMRVSHVKLPPDMSVETAIEFYSGDPGVEYAEPNYLRYATAKIPDDPGFRDLWGLNNTGQIVWGTRGTEDADIDAPEAWDFTTGTGLVIAVIDGGVDYNHPDLSGNIWSNNGEIPDNGIDDDGNDYIDDIRGWDFYDGDNDPTDPDGHGTHVAGIIAAEGDNGVGVTGVCWTAEIMILKAADDSGTFAVSEIILAINYAVDKEAKVINASFAGTGFSNSELTSISKANDAKVLLVAAAGNSGTDNDDPVSSPAYPASYDLENIIAVAATDQEDEFLSDSNYGSSTVDVGAPGKNILSTWPGGAYAYLGGTSTAASHVTGLAGLIWSLNPGLTLIQVKDIILDSVDSNGSLLGKTVTGGRINAFNALDTAGSTTPGVSIKRSGGSDDCFIATAAFGAPMKPQVSTLRTFRDRYLLKNRLGEILVSLYYRYSPLMADYIVKHGRLKPIVRIGLLPVVWVAAFLLNISLIQKAILLISLMILLTGVLLSMRRRRKSEVVNNFRL